MLFAHGEKVNSRGDNTSFHKKTLSREINDQYDRLNLF